MGKCPLQSFHFTILTFFLSFYNTRLKLLDRFLRLVPVYTGPTLVSVRRRTLNISISFICFPPLRSSLSYLVKELPSGSLPTFVEDDVVNDTRDIGLILIHSVTEWHSLFHNLIPTYHSAFLAVCLPLWEIYRLTEFHVDAKPMG